MLRSQEERVVGPSQLRGMKYLPMSGSPTFNTEKKKENRKIERDESITPPRPTGRRSNNYNNHNNLQQPSNCLFKCLKILDFCLFWAWVTFP